MQAIQKNKILRLVAAVFLAFVMLITLTPPPALAQSAASSTNANATSTNRREEVRADIRARAIEHIYQVARRIAARLQAAINRLKGLTDRISSRITNLKERGINMSAADAKLLITTDKINAAQTSWNSLNSAFGTAFNASTTRENMKIARDLIAPTTKATKDAHKAVVELLRVVKAAAGSDNNPGQATSTASTTTSN